ncbi:hypothetical protein T492DRAFT_1128450, partial [Pavlovales sp. CCMP2436]
ACSISTGHRAQQWPDGPRAGHRDHHQGVVQDRLYSMLHKGLPALREAGLPLWPRPPIAHQGAAGCRPTPLKRGDRMAQGNTRGRPPPPPGARHQRAPEEAPCPLNRQLRTCDTARAPIPCRTNQKTHNTVDSTPPSRRVQLPGRRPTRTT